MNLYKTVHILLALLLSVTVWAEDGLRVTTANRAGGTVSATLVAGRTYSIEAAAAKGYTFMGWSDGEASATRMYEHLPETSEDKIFHAIFTKDVDITKAEGHTNVSIQDAAVPSFWLEAEPNAGMSLYKWNNGSTTVQQSYVEADGTRIPYFAVATSRISVTTDQHAGGIVTATQVADRKYSFLANANEGYTFLGWTDDLNPSHNPREYTHAAESSADKLFYAVFAKNEDTSLPGGTVTVGVNNATTPSFDLTAHPGITCITGTTIYKWTTGSTANPMVGYQESDGKCIPYFTRGDNAVGYEKNEQAGGKIEITPLECGFHLKAVPNEGYAFVQWQDDAAELADRNVDYNAGQYFADFAQANFKVGEQYFVTLDAAAAYAESSIIEMIRNVTNVTVSTDAKLDANGHSITNLTITCGGKLTLTEALTVVKLCLNATAGRSAQLVGGDKLTYSDAYLDIQLDPNADKADPSLWYAFSLPFPVDVATGISRKEGNTSHSIGKDYLVCEYDGDTRAATGEGWSYMYSGTLTPGKCYMLIVNDTHNIWRFTQKTSTALEGDSTIELKQYFTTSCKHRGWNAVGNSTLHYTDASIASGISIAQVYVNGANPARYDVKHLSESSFVVGSPFFIQTEADDVMTLSNATHGQLLAPSRHSASECPYYRIALYDVQGNELDVAYLTTSEDAKNEYVIGKDVIKIMGGDGNAYLWLSNYGYKLCAHDALMVDHVAQCHIGLAIPSTETYTLTVTGPDKVALYQKDGFVWPNATGGFDLELLSGTTTDILLQVGTEWGIITSTGQSKQTERTEVFKFIFDGQLYISCENGIYNTIGNMVK